MADQASVRNGHGARNNGSGMASRLAEFGNDVATLAELQARLAAIELKENTERSVLPIVFLAGAAALLLASLFVALMGVAWLLARALAIHQGWALLLTAGMAFVIAAVIALVAGLRLGHSFDGFRRSREELARNLAWIRTVLLHSGRPATASAKPGR